MTIQNDDFCFRCNCHLALPTSSAEIPNPRKDFIRKNMFAIYVQANLIADHKFVLFPPAMQAELTTIQRFKLLISIGWSTQVSFQAERWWLQVNPTSTAGTWLLHGAVEAYPLKKMPSIFIRHLVEGLSRNYLECLSIALEYFGLP